MGVNKRKRRKQKRRLSPRKQARVADAKNRSVSHGGSSQKRKHSASLGVYPYEPYKNDPTERSQVDDRGVRREFLKNRGIRYSGSSEMKLFKRVFADEETLRELQKKRVALQDYLKLLGLVALTNLTIEQQSLREADAERSGETQVWKQGGLSGAGALVRRHLPSAGGGWEHGRSSPRERQAKGSIGARAVARVVGLDTRFCCWQVKCIKEP